MSAEAERELILRAIKDHRAFRELVLKHQSQVRGLLLRLTHQDKSRSDDLAQEVFLSLFQKLESFQFNSRFSTWLYRMTYNTFLDDQRKRKAQQKLMENEKQIPDLKSTPKLDLVQSVQKGLSLLKEEERVALIFTLIEGLTHEEAAEALGWPLGTVKTHVSRGRENLKDLMISFGWEVSL